MRRLVFAFLFIAACGGSTSAVSSSDGDGGTDSGTGPGTDGGKSYDAGPRGDGGCIVAPVVGAPCSKDDVACDDGQDVCCRGYVWNCDPTNGWQKLGLGCACQVPPPTFPCGDKTCTSQQYCQDTNVPNHLDGGSSQSYQCIDIPSACTATPTCVCLSQHVGCQCQVVDGHLQTLCLAP